MKRTVAWLLIAAFVLWVAADAIHEFQVNDATGFYTANPDRLLRVAVLATLGGLLAFGYSASGCADRRPWQFSLAAIFLVMATLAWVFALVHLLVM